MFLPKKSAILENIVKLSSLVEDAALIFQRIAYDWSRLKDGCAELQAKEQEADEQVHVVTDDIEKIFILPFDKEDIKELTDLLDDVIDCIEEAANLLSIYEIAGSNKGLMGFSDLVLQSARQIHGGILILAKHKMNSKDLPLYYRKIHCIENDGDNLHRMLLGELMGSRNPDKNTISIIKMKEIFLLLEDTLDKCEDIAVLFEKFRIKYR